MKLELGFGTGTQTVELPDKNVLDVLMPNHLMHRVNEEAALIHALDFPIGAPLLKNIIHSGQKIVLITSDITRPCPTRKILPVLLNRLFQAGARAEDITLVFALGSHRHHTPEEMEQLAGPAYHQIRCVDSDPGDCIRMGVTKAGTPVDITSVVAQADIRICIGNIEYHYFAGYSGGAKAIMPGVSSRSAIQSNPRLMVQENARTGLLEGNPLREDIEEAAAMCGVDYIINVILDEHKQIVKAVAGDVVQAHREGCRFLDQLYQKRIARKADIVLVSQGGAPKDINLYQTQKALDNAKHAVRDGGIILLMGSCKEGLGEQVFQQWILDASCPDDLIKRVQEDFQLGGHKAAAIAMVLKKVEICLVSEMPESLVHAAFLKPFTNAQAALDAAFEKLGQDASVLVMPYGGSTLPVLVEQLSLSE